MPTTQLHQTITATPEHILAGITDVGPGRSQLFPNSADDQLEVYDTTEPGEPHAILLLRAGRRSPTEPTEAPAEDEQQWCDLPLS